LSKAIQGHLKAIIKDSKSSPRWLREWRLAQDKDLPELGAKFDVSMFEVGERVNVSALSKGRGFQGVVKRHGFRGGPKSHGQKHHLRAPGSLGPTAFQRVIKGRRMAGHMGMRRVTIKNLKVVEVLPEKNLLALEGGIPGARGTLVKVYK
ncbi:MAG: 50S ribosomal protein L3, partial [Candidatus Paceibacteria bacterium]